MIVFLFSPALAELIVEGATSPGPSGVSVADQRERRRAVRVAINREVRYRLAGEQTTGHGRTVNLSSTGILFSADRRVVPGHRIELTITWPVRSDYSRVVFLLAAGKVVRVEDGCIAVELDRYEFRHSGHEGLAP